MNLISVIVPIYKVEPYLDKCIASIVDQTFQELEIILVDDGSPDNCPAICDMWAGRDSRIKVIHKQNGGLSDARNAGLSVATGDFIGFIDSDDWIEPDFFESLYRAIIENDADVAECSVDYVDENGAVLRTRKVAETKLDHLDALRRLVLEDGVYQTVWDKLYRTEVIKGIPFEKGKCNEDEFWTDQVLDKSRALAVVKRPLYHYLQRGSSIIGSGYQMNRLDGLEARFLRMQRLQKYSDLADLTRQEFILDCMWNLQSAYRCLDPKDIPAARKIVLGYKECTPMVKPQNLTLNWKYRIWYALFQAAPVFTVMIRNKMKIGV